MEATNALLIDDKQTRVSDTGVALRITEGLHYGASHPLTNEQVLLIGRSLDCDLVLSDDDIAERQCLLGRSEQGFWLRVLADSVVVNGQPLYPGDIKHFALETSFSFGSVVVLVTTRTMADCPDLAAMPAVLNHQTVTRKRQTGWVILVLLVCGISIAGVLNDQGQWKDVIDRYLPAMVSTPDALSADKQGATGVVVPPNERVLKQPDHRPVTGDDPLEEMHRYAGVDNIAGDVSEIFRLSGVDAQTRYLGEGVIEVTGHFDDGAAVAGIIQSRAVREIRGLDKIIVNNLDTKIKTRPAPNRLKTVAMIVDGDDPYLVTKDGSRYYLDARLPGGDKLTAINSKEITIQSAAGTTRKLGLGAMLGQ